jgi:pyruvate dehydrogenase E2 component (dihydrolipoamide acetyltransferase)
VAIDINVPRLGWSLDEGTFLEWRKRDGDSIKPGDVLFVLESDKAAEEIAALDAGILRLLPGGPKPGDIVKVSQVIGYLVAEGEAIPTEVMTRPASVKTAAGVAAPISAPSRVARRTHAAISPRARRLAGELGIDWSGLAGSGRNGRIRERDIQTVASGQARAGRLIPHTNVRRTIAARMAAGATQSAPVTLTTQVDAGNLVDLHNQLKTAATADDIVPSYTDLIIKLTAVALRQHPLLQAQWRDDGLFVPHRLDIAIGVDADAGLLAPVIRDVDRLTLCQVAVASRDLIRRARAGQLAAEEVRDATFTVTNLGGLGIDAFTPIIQLPQSAVLGIGRIARQPAVVDDQIVPRPMLTLSLTCDHRVVDGAPAARFLATLRGCLEQPSRFGVGP